MKIYYAHSMHLYGKPQEKRDVQYLENLGFEVLNPNDTLCKEMCENRRKQAIEEGLTKDQTSDLVMGGFKEIVEGCDALDFRAHPDGKIPSGVGKEVKWAMEAEMTIIELPTLLNSRFMEIGETRQYLEYLGER